MHYRKNRIITALFVFVAAFVSLPFLWFYNKPVHFSIDDVEICMRDLCQGDKKYESIFQHSFFSFLKKLHNRTGAKITLYTYENCCDSTGRIPKHLIQEIRDNADWLRFGYHAKVPEFIIDSVAIKEYFENSYNSFEKSGLIGGGKNQVLRLHYYFATQDEVMYLKGKGVGTLLSADDERISYSLPRKIDSILQKEERINYHGMNYERTDIRIEKTVLPIANLIENRNDDKIIIFTHEWALAKTGNIVKLYLTLYFLHFYNAVFII